MRIGCITRHYRAAGTGRLRGCTVVEVSLLTALHARSSDAPRAWLVGVESRASEAHQSIWQAEQILFELNPPVPGVCKSPSPLDRTVVYLTKGLASLQAIEHILPYYEISAFVLPIENPQCGFENDAQVAREARSL